MRNAIHRERGPFVKGGRRPSIEGGKPFIKGGGRPFIKGGGRPFIKGGGRLFIKGRRRLFRGWRPFIKGRRRHTGGDCLSGGGRSSGGGHLLREPIHQERRPLLREGEGCSSREGGTGRRPFIERRGCLLKAVCQGREEAIHGGREEAVHQGRGEYSLRDTAVRHCGGKKEQ